MLWTIRRDESAPRPRRRRETARLAVDPIVESQARSDRLTMAPRWLVEKGGHRPIRRVDDLADAQPSPLCWPGRCAGTSPHLLPRRLLHSLTSPAHQLSGRPRLSHGKQDPDMDRWWLTETSRDQLHDHVK